MENQQGMQVYPTIGGVYQLLCNNYVLVRLAGFVIWALQPLDSLINNLIWEPLGKGNYDVTATIYTVKKETSRVLFEIITSHPLS